MARTIAQIMVESLDAGKAVDFGLRLPARGKLMVGLDHGNDALKLAMLGPSGQFVTLRIPTAHCEAEEIRAGAGEVSYAVNGGTRFWAGETALRHQGDDLPIGPTRQRIVDLRLRELLAASLVELLSRAGLQPGNHQILLGFAIPNTEIVYNQDDRLGVDEETKQLVNEYLNNQVLDVVRQGEDRAESIWRLTIAGVLPQAQTVGTMLAVTRTPTGAVETDIEEVDIVDIGGGDLQLTSVQFSPDYRMTTRRLGDGTIRVARALRDHFVRLELNDVSAQHALITRKLMVSGRNRDIGAEVDQAVSGQGASIVASVLPHIRQSRRYVIITGGGVILLHDILRPRLEAESKVAGEDYLLVDSRIASLLNAVGVLFSVLFRVSKRG